MIVDIDSASQSLNITTTRLNLVGSKWRAAHSTAAGQAGQHDVAVLVA